MFIVRDANGLYALTSRCPHQGVTLSAQTSTSKFHCNAHGADFTFNGAVIDRADVEVAPALQLVLTAQR